MVRRRGPSQRPTSLSGNGPQSYIRSRVLVWAMASRPVRLVHEGAGEPSVAVGRRPTEAQRGEHWLVRGRSRASAGILAVTLVTALVSQVTAAVAFQLATETSTVAGIRACLPALFLHALFQRLNLAVPSSAHARPHERGEGRN